MIYIVATIGSPSKQIMERSLYSSSTVRSTRHCWLPYTINTKRSVHSCNVTEFQQDVYLQYASSVICIHSTHKTNMHDLQLVTPINGDRWAWRRYTVSYDLKKISQNIIAQTFKLLYITRLRGIFLIVKSSYATFSTGSETTIGN